MEHERHVALDEFTILGKTYPIYQVWGIVLKYNEVGVIDLTTGQAIVISRSSYIYAMINSMALSIVILGMTEDKRKVINTLVKSNDPTEMLLGIQLAYNWYIRGRRITIT